MSPAVSLFIPTARFQSHSWHLNTTHFFLRRCVSFLRHLPWEYLLSRCLPHSCVCRSFRRWLESGEEAWALGCPGHSAVQLPHLRPLTGLLSSLKGAVVKQSDNEQLALLTLMFCPHDSQSQLLVLDSQWPTACLIYILYMLLLKQQQWPFIFWALWCLDKGWEQIQRQSCVAQLGLITPLFSVQDAVGDVIGEFGSKRSDFLCLHPKTIKMYCDT